MKKELTPADLEQICSENTVVAFAYYVSHQKCMQALSDAVIDGIEYGVEVNYRCEECSGCEQEGYDDEQTIEKALNERFYPLGIVKPNGEFEFIGAFYDAFKGEYLTSSETEDRLKSLIPDSFEEESYEENYYFDSSYGNYLPDTKEVMVTVNVETDLNLDIDLEYGQDYLDEDFADADKNLMNEISMLFSDKDKAVKESEKTVKEMARATPLFKETYPRKTEKSLDVKE